MLEWRHMGREKITAVGTGAPVCLTNFASEDNLDRLGISIANCDPTGANTLYIKFNESATVAPSIDTGAANGYHETVPAVQSVDFRCPRGVHAWAISDVGTINAVCVEKRP